MTDNNNDIRYSISPADEPAGGRGTPASDLLIEAPAQKHTPAPDYGTKTESGIRQNLTHTDIPPSVLRDMLREAEAAHERGKKRRSRKLFGYLFRVTFTILGTFMFFYFVGTLSPETFLDYIWIAVESAITSAFISLILAPISMPVWYGAQKACFADEFDELYQIEHIKDRMGQR